MRVVFCLWASVTSRSDDGMEWWCLTRNVFWLLRLSENKHVSVEKIHPHDPNHIIISAYNKIIVGAIEYVDDTVQYSAQECCGSPLTNQVRDKQEQQAHCLDLAFFQFRGVWPSATDCSSRPLCVVWIKNAEAQQEFNMPFAINRKGNTFIMIYSSLSFY